MKTIAILRCCIFMLVVISIAANSSSSGGGREMMQDESIESSYTVLDDVPYCKPDNEGDLLTVPIPLCIVEPILNEDGSLSPPFDPVPTCGPNSSPACPDDDDGNKSVTCSSGLVSISVCVNTDPPADDPTDPPADDVTVPPATDDVTAPPADDAAVEDSDDPLPDGLLLPYDEGTDLSDAVKPSSVAPKKKKKRKNWCPKGHYYRARDPDHGGKAMCYTCRKRNGYSFKFAMKRNGSLVCRYTRNRG